MKKIIFLRTSSKPIPRLKRVAHVADELGYHSLFVGANREMNLPANDNWDGIDVERVGKFYPLLNGKSLIRYFMGVISYNIGAFNLLRKKKPDIVHFSDVESFLAVFFYKFFSKVKTLYNIHDNFAQRYVLPKFLNFILNVIEGLIVKFSDATMVPEEFRLNALPKFCRKKISVVRNTPIDPGAYEHNGFDKEKIKIVFAGWFDQGRGISTLLQLADLDSRFELHFAGEGNKELINEVTSRENCIFHGFLNHEKVLDLTKSCDFVFAHYCPSRVINIYAAPNKLAESLAIGRPVIINSETFVSKLVAIKDAGVVTKYDDVHSLYEKIISLSSDYEFYKKCCSNARRLFEEDYSWGNVKLKIKEVFQKVDY